METLRGSYVGLPAHTTCRVWLSDKDANFIKNRGLSRACFVVRPVSAPRTCRSTSARGRKTKEPIRSTPLVLQQRSIALTARFANSLWHYNHWTPQKQGLPLKMIILVCISLHLMGKNTGVSNFFRAGAVGTNAPSIFLLPKILFLFLRWRWQIKFGWVEERGICLLITGSNQSSLFLIWLFRKLKFLIPMVDIAPRSTSQVTPNE